MSRERKVFITIALALMAVLFFTACGGGTDQPPAQNQGGQPQQSQQGQQGQPNQPPQQGSPPPASSDGPQYGGILRVATAADTSMALGFPWEHQVFPSQFLLSGYVEPLLIAKSDGTFDYSLATAFEGDPENLEIRFTLREGVKFSDGSDFNAEAVAWNVQMQIDTREMNPAVIGVEATGEYTVTVYLNQYLNSIFPIFSNRPFSMISKANYETNGADFARQNPVGTGPFVLDRQIPAVSVTYSKNPNYWREGMPYLDGLEFISMTDVMTQNAAMISTGSDGIDQLTTGNYEQVSMLRDQAPVYITMLPSGYSAMIPNSGIEGSPMADVRVRQAVAYAIDREALTAARGFGIGRPATQILAEGFIGHLEDKSLNLSYDPARSRELLAEAGFPDGFTTQFHHLGGDRDVATALQGMLSEIGITAQMNFPEAGAASELRGGVFEGFLFTQITNLTNSGSTIRLNMDPDYQYFPSMWRPAEEMRQDFNSLRAAVGLDAEELHASRINRLFLENMVLIPVLDTQSCWIMKNNVHDTGFGFHTPQTVWLPYQTWKSDPL